MSFKCPVATTKWNMEDNEASHEELEATINTTQEQIKATEPSRTR
jgi:transcription initiation factor IIE alpha subunit